MRPGRLHVLIFLDDRAVCDNLTTYRPPRFPDCLLLEWRKKMKDGVGDHPRAQHPQPPDDWWCRPRWAACRRWRTWMVFMCNTYFYIFVCDSRFVSAICGSKDRGNSCMSRSDLFELKKSFWTESLFSVWFLISGRVFKVFMVVYVNNF